MSLEKQLSDLIGSEVTDLRRLTGGASRTTYAFGADGRRLILRTGPPDEVHAGMELEAAVQRLATTGFWDVPVETPSGPLHLPAVPGRIAKASLLADPSHAPLQVEQTDKGVAITLPPKAPDAIASVICLETTAP